MDISWLPHAAGRRAGGGQKYSIPNNYNINGTPLCADPVDKYVITIDNLTIFVYAEFNFMLASTACIFFLWPKRGSRTQWTNKCTMNLYQINIISMYLINQLHDVNKPDSVKQTLELRKYNIICNNLLISAWPQSPWNAHGIRSR